MNNDHFQKVLKLISRTGDKGFIIDETKDQMFALMSVDAYEKILDQIDLGNLPKDKNEDGLDDYVLDDIIDIEERRTSEVKEKNPLTTIPPSGFETEKKLDFSESWTENIQLKENAVQPEESLSDIPHDGEEEERFYLEPVE